jgi:LPXTG-site transpeptidase (sortase) family protein
MKKINYAFLNKLSASVLTLSLAFIFNFFVLSFLTYSADQVRLQNAFASQVSNATAPIAERDYEGQEVKDGAPVARLVIDQINLDVIVVEGTDSNTMRSGVGHRRDTVLPGQEGMTVLFGRTWSYGAPFGQITKLEKGDVFTVYTGQGKSEYSVTGIRKAGDKGLAPVKAGTNQLVLTAAEGEFFNPSSVVRVDAELLGTAYETGLRITKWGEIPAESRELGIDTRSVWVLLIDLVMLLIAQVAAIWFASRFGRVKAWLVFAPGLILVLVLTIDQTTRLLPNLI